MSARSGLIIRQPSSEAQGPSSPTRAAEGLVDLEFSDYGRDPRFLPGWWVVPALFGAPLTVWLFLAWL